MTLTLCFSPIGGCHRNCDGQCPYAPIIMPDDERKALYEADPNGLSAKAPGAKLDAGKAPVRRGLLEYFPRACMAVANVSAAGAAKYSWGGWQTVANGINRYGDAGARHICKAVIEGQVDPDAPAPGIWHAAEEAWNALARLELELREAEASGVAEPWTPWTVQPAAPLTRSTSQSAEPTASAVKHC